ncbi:MAG: FAD-binding oxidoreductase, partial [Verrucomicrobiota bacterium]
ISAESGLLLQDLRDVVGNQAFTRPYFFTPDPTETTASIGGMAATDASGAMSYSYGPTRNAIKSLEVILADGEVLRLVRGRNFAENRNFRLKTETGKVIEGSLPSFEMPDVKNAAGYFIHPDMDLIDLFIGSEGTLGIISKVELILVPAPAAIWGIMIFLPSLDSAINFVEKARTRHNGIAALELFDDKSLDLLRNMKKADAGFEDLPDIPDQWKVAVYAEFHGRDTDSVEESALNITELLNEEGGSEENTWLASDEREMQKLKDFRHAVPEAVNSLVDRYRKNEPELTKLGTDLAVPDNAFREMFSMYTYDLAKSGMEYVIFGHAGDNHVHVNIIPKKLEEYDTGKKLYLRWAEKVVNMGGTVSGEHGIGKLKRDMLQLMYKEDIIKQMQDLKETFDPGWQLNPGDMFERPKVD